jgi:Holliday junction resolvase RusA-like endonuclease
MDRAPIIITIPGEPVAKGRPRAFVRNGRIGVHTPAKTASFENLVKMAAREAMMKAGIFAPLEGALQMQIRAVYLIPASWSKKRRDAAKWRTSRPDADNLAKGVCDACNDIAYLDDSQVASITIQKVYGMRAETIVTISELE